MSEKWEPPIIKVFIFTNSFDSYALTKIIGKFEEKDSKFSPVFSR